VAIVQTTRHELARQFDEQLDSENGIEPPVAAPKNPKTPVVAAVDADFVGVLLKGRVEL
jgi:hypothetical protein